MRTAEEILDLPMTDNDAGASTIREYLYVLLATLWTEGEGFSGKRPFGNSGWEDELYIPLVKFGEVAGSLDKFGNIEYPNFGKYRADEIILSCIRYAFMGER